jgi:hypothetical protein
MGQVCERILNLYRLLTFAPSWRSPPGSSQLRSSASISAVCAVNWPSAVNGCLYFLNRSLRQPELGECDERAATS